MIPENRESRRYRILIFAALFLCLSIGLQVCTHQWDNKYTYNEEEQPVCGVLSLSAESLDKQAYYICNDWEFYRGRLLSHEDFDRGQLFPDEYIRLGQYAGFELADHGQSPHGSATYRLRILLPEEKRQYTLELPEIFSAYKLWVNGELTFQSGEPDPAAYRPEVVQTKVSFEAQGEAELVFAVSDFSHYYSGMVYPPAFGTEQQVNRLLSGRLVLKSIQCFFAFVVFLCYGALYLGQRQNKRKLYMALACLGYLGYGGYLLIHTFLPTGNFLWYRLEDFSMFFMLFFLCRLVSSMRGENQPFSFKKTVTVLSLLMMAASLVLPGFFGMTASTVLPGFFGGGNLGLMLIYGGLVDVYKLLVVGYLLLHTCFMAMGRQERSLPLFGALPLLGALLFFGTGLAADRLDRIYEPVLLGWGAEYGGFVLIAVLAAMMVMESLAAQKSNRQLIERGEQKTRYIEEVIHDLKSPLATITTYAELSRMGIAEEPEQQKEFLLEIEERAKELAERIQKLRHIDGSTLSPCLSPVNSLTYLREIAAKYSLLLTHKGLDLQVTGENFSVSIDKEQMGLALENLIMNGMRYTKAGGCIVLSARIRKGKKELVVSDTGEGMDAEYLNTIFSRGVTQNRTEHTGLGLFIVSEIARAHHGSVLVESQPGKGSSFILRL